MTIPTETSRMDYVGNGVTTIYPYTFKIDDETELVVVKADANGTETDLVLNTDYTVSGVGSQGGGNVTLTTALASGYALTIQVTTPFTQETDIKNQGAFAPQVIEDALDHGIRAVQALANSVGRAVRLPVTATGIDTNLANLAAGQFFRLSDDGTRLEGAQAFATLTDATQDGKTYGRKDGAWAEAVPDGSITVTKISALPFWASILNFTEIAITGATAATANRMHVVSGTSADYTITLPAAPASGTVVGLRVKDYTASSKRYTLDAGGTVKIAGRTRYLVILHTNVVLLQFDGTDWQPLVLSLDTLWVNSGVVTITGSGSNPAKGTTSSDSVRWRRVGGNCEAHLSYRQSTAGSAGSGSYFFSIPIAADTSQIPVYDTAYSNAVVGSACAELAGTSSCSGSASLISSTTVALFVGENANSVGSARYSMSNAGQNFSYHVSYPATNW